MELPIVMKRRVDEDDFIYLTIDKNDIGIVITTTPPGRKRPKSEVEGYGALKQSVEDRILAIVNQKLGEGYFSDILDASRQELDYFIANFRDEASLEGFLGNARTAGILLDDRRVNGIVELQFDGFLLNAQRNIEGIGLALAVPRALRAKTVPVFYAMKDFTIKLTATEPEGKDFDLRATYLQLQRNGGISANAAVLLELVGVAIKPLSANLVNRGRGTRFTMTL